jgi:hypothetical protein
VKVLMALALAMLNQMGLPVAYHAELGSTRMVISVIHGRPVSSNRVAKCVARSRGQ